VADGHLTTTKQQVVRYGAIAAAIVVLAVGALYLLGRGEPPASATAETAAAPANPKPPPAADEPVIPSSTQSDQLVSLVGDARRIATQRLSRASKTRSSNVLPVSSRTKSRR